MSEQINKQNEHITIKDFIWEIIKFSILAAIIVVPIRMFIAQPFIVDGRSMEPTFSTGQYLIVDEISYKFENPKRGDIIIFKYPKNESKYFIKRLIGIPGDTIDIKNGVVTIKTKNNPAGFKLKEPYVKLKKDDTMTRELGNNEYFVMGDNRAESFDSRAWGDVPRKLIVGRALIRLFPVSKASLMPGKYKYISSTKNIANNLI